MTLVRVGLVQLCSSDRPDENLLQILDGLRQAAAAGADLVATPEVSNCVSNNRHHQTEVLRPESSDQTLAAVQDEAKILGVWVLVGSFALRSDDPDGRFVNRSFLITPQGEIYARYDKIHMFDVELSKTESYHESKGYRPGTEAVVARTPFGTIGLTICYDLRFPSLYRTLAQNGAEILTIPSAFTRPTGEAHWDVLLRARAIETGCFVVAPAQTGEHKGSGRKTYGHSMVVAPWGEVLADAGTFPGVTLCDIDLSAVAQARQRVPSLGHDRGFTLGQ